METMSGKWVVEWHFCRDWQRPDGTVRHEESRCLLTYEDASDETFMGNFKSFEDLDGYPQMYDVVLFDSEAEAMAEVRRLEELEEQRGSAGNSYYPVSC